MGMLGEETPIHEKSQKTLANSQDEREQRDERIVQGTRSLEIKDPLIRTWSPPLNRRRTSLCCDTTERVVGNDLAYLISSTVFGFSVSGCVGADRAEIHDRRKPT